MLFYVHYIRFVAVASLLCIAIPFSLTDPEKLLKKYDSSHLQFAKEKSSQMVRSDPRNAVAVPHEVYALRAEEKVKDNHPCSQKDSSEEMGCQITSLLDSEVLSVCEDVRSTAIISWDRKVVVLMK